MDLAAQLALIVGIAAACATFRLNRIAHHWRCVRLLAILVLTTTVVGAIAASGA